jgi:hypothetical protein
MATANCEKYEDNSGKCTKCINDNYLDTATGFCHSVTNNINNCLYY